MNRFSQQELRLKKNWGNTYRANLRAAIEALPKFVPMPPLSVLRATPSVALDSAEYNKLRDAMQASFDQANEAIDSIRANLVLLQATPDYEFETEVLASRNEAPAASAGREANNPLTAWAIELLVVAGHVSREKADEAYRIACETFARENSATAPEQSAKGLTMGGEAQQ